MVDGDEHVCTTSSPGSSPTHPCIPSLALQEQVGENTGNKVDICKAGHFFHKILSLDLRPKQCQGVRALLQGRDVLAVLPTEYSKSLISKDFLNFQHEYHMFYI